MHRKAILGLGALIAAALACNTPGGSAPEPTIEPQATAQVIVITATSLPATSAPATQSVPTAPSTAIPPSISANITFAETADAAAGSRSFHEGVTRIYALLKYANMSEQLLVRRDWYLDGALWLSKSDRWSVAKYGRNGTLTDVSIYDLQNGLPSGHFELRIYINEIAQFTSADDIAQRSFEIVKGVDGGH